MEMQAQNCWYPSLAQYDRVPPDVDAAMKLIELYGKVACDSADFKEARDYAVIVVRNYFGFKANARTIDGKKLSS